MAKSQNRTTTITSALVTELACVVVIRRSVLTSSPYSARYGVTVTAAWRVPAIRGRIASITLRGERVRR